VEIAAHDAAIGGGGALRAAIHMGEGTGTIGALCGADVDFIALHVQPRCRMGGMNPVQMLVGMHGGAHVQQAQTRRVPEALQPGDR
jgi:hypothetical protein